MTRSALEAPEVRHLLRRFGFAALPAQVARLAGRPLEAVLDDWLDQGARESPQDPPPSGGIDSLQVWWLERMLRGRAPRESLAVFLQSHFGSSTTAVTNTSLLGRRVQLFRRYALGRYPQLLQALLLDPATMLQIGLNGHDVDRVSDRPAKIVLEQWTVGPGRFSNQDLEDLSRALTGWRVVPAGDVTGSVPEARFDLSRHDQGLKTLFGRTGRFDAAAAMSILALRPQTGDHLCRALLVELGIPDPPGELLAELARLWVSTQGSIPDLLRAALRSDAFWTPASRWQVIKSPVRLAIGACSQLGIDSVPAGLGDWVAACGQPLFDTPENGEQPWPRDDQWFVPPERLARRYRLSQLLPVPDALHSQTSAAAWRERLDPAPGLETALLRGRRRESRIEAERIAGRIIDSAQYQLA